MSEAINSPEAKSRRFRPYPKYKDPGIEWLGDIPATWRCIRLRFAARLNPTKNEICALDPQLPVSFVPMDAVGEYGGLRLEDTRPVSALTAGYTYFRDDDVIVAKITPCFENGKGALAQELMNGIAFGTTELHVLRPQQYIDAHFLFYLTLSAQFRSLGTAEMFGAAGQKRVPEDFILNFPVTFPNLQDQRFIVVFLDRETAKIDELIEKKKRLIELLQEKRSALITQAVIKGLNPSVPMKDSGVEWLGKIPAHWAMESNKRLFENSDIRSGNLDEELLTVSHITGVTRHSEKNVTMIEAESYEDYKICRVGELAINTMWAWMGALGIAKENGIVSPSYNVYALKTSSLDSRYYDYLCRTPLHIAELTRYSKGIWKSRLRLYPDGFFEISTPLPPIKEQERIANELDNAVRRIDALLMIIRRAVGFLREYRSALISATVTGKIDVQNRII